MVRPSEHDRPAVAAARVAWHAAAPTWDLAHFVFLDETGLTNNLLRRYGRAPCGACVHDHSPCGRWQTSTFLAALRVTGLTASGGFDGAIDGESFRAYIETARCRSSETLWPFLGTCLEHFSPDECRNYFRHCGSSAVTRS